MNLGPELPKLRNEFDDVRLWYPTDNRGAKTGNVVAVLHKGDKRYFGLSLLHPLDNFNRKKGRAIALGRALSAWDVDENNAFPRLKQMQLGTSRTLTTIQLKKKDEVILCGSKARGGTWMITVPDWLYTKKEDVGNKK